MSMPLRRSGGLVHRAAVAALPATGGVKELRPMPARARVPGFRGSPRRRAAGGAAASEALVHRRADRSGSSQDEVDRDRIESGAPRSPAILERADREASSRPAIAVGSRSRQQRFSRFFHHRVECRSPALARIGTARSARDPQAPDILPRLGSADEPVWTDGVDAPAARRPTRCTSGLMQAHRCSDTIRHGRCNRHVFFLLLRRRVASMIDARRET